MHWTACRDPNCVTHKSSHEYGRSFTKWGRCEYCNGTEHNTKDCPVKKNDDEYTESPKLPPQRLQPGVPAWALQIESLPNSSEISDGHPATPPMSSTPPRAPTPPLDIDYDSSTMSEEVDSPPLDIDYDSSTISEEVDSPPFSPVTKLALRSRSPQYSSNPETLPSYSPVPEAQEYVFYPRIVFNDHGNKTTEELSFKSFNSTDPNMESRQIPIDGSGNKS